MSLLDSQTPLAGKEAPADFRVPDGGKSRGFPALGEAIFGEFARQSSHWVAIAIRLRHRPGPAEHPSPPPRMQIREHLAAKACKDSPQLSKYRNGGSTKLPCS